MIQLTEAGGGMPLYQLKITLRDCRPPIWRRIVVRAAMKLDRLHRVIQIAMGWTNSHLHQFVLGGVYYGQPDREWDAEDTQMLNEKRYTVTELAPKVKARFAHIAIFDAWVEHRLQSVARLSDTQLRQHIPAMRSSPTPSTSPKPLRPRAQASLANDQIVCGTEEPRLSFLAR
jgi:hypothetical protein